jgi:hypothetical protein
MLADLSLSGHLLQLQTPAQPFAPEGITDRIHDVQAAKSTVIEDFYFDFGT